MKAIYLKYLLVAVSALMLHGGCKKDDVSTKNTTRLESLAAEAVKVSTAVQEGPDPGLYPVGATKQLQLAIDSAWKLSSTSVSQYGIDLAEIYLQKAIKQFQESVQQERQLYFDGTGYLDGGLATAYNTPNITLQAWVYLTEFKTGMYVISTEGNQNGYKLQIPAGKATFQIGNGTTILQVSAPTAVDLNTWTHIAASFDGAKMKLYVNGLMVAERALAYQITDNGQNFRIGEGSRFTGRTFKGRIKEVGVWSKALSDAEINALMTTKITGTESGLTAYWPFNLSAGSKILDRTGSREVNLINIQYTDPI